LGGHVVDEVSVTLRQHTSVVCEQSELTWHGQGFPVVQDALVATQLVVPTQQIGLGVPAHDAVQGNLGCTAHPPSLASPFASAGASVP
jgi:hypothetical protein